MTNKEERAIMARINPEFMGHMKKSVVLEYPRLAADESYDEARIKSELRRIKIALSDAISAGESTEDLLVKREALYLLAEDKGLM